MNDLQRRGVDEYNRQPEAGVITNVAKTPQKLLDQASVNYLRHHHTPYDAWLFAGAKEDPELLTLARQRVYRAIAGAYPQLADECARQLRIKTEELRPLDGTRAIC